MPNQAGNGRAPGGLSGRAGMKERGWKMRVRVERISEVLVLVGRGALMPSMVVDGELAYWVKLEELGWLLVERWCEMVVASSQ